MKKKKNNIVYRKCVITNKKFSKDQLLRFSIIDNTLILDNDNKYKKRGLYIICNQDIALNLVNSKKYKNFIKNKEQFLNTISSEIIRRENNNEKT